MKRLSFILGIIMLFIAAPLAAQERSVDLLGFVSWVDVSGDTELDEDAEDFGLEFDSDMGYGAGVNIFWSNRISTEFTASVISPEVNVTPTNSTIPPFLAGELEMLPITGTLQFHLSPNGRFDPYVGAGVAYILFDDLDEEDDLDDVDVEAIEFEDDYGFLVNAGVDIGLSDMFAINLDAKYVPLESSATAVFATGPGEATEIELNPLMLQAGVRLRF